MEELLAACGENLVLNPASSCSRLKKIDYVWATKLSFGLHLESSGSKAGRY